MLGRSLPDYYAVLGLTVEASHHEIRTAYQRLVVEFHPDKTDGSTTEQFVLIQEAWEALRDEERRSAYDRRRKRVCLKDIVGLLS